MHSGKKTKSPLKFRAIPYRPPEIDKQCWNCRQGKRAIVSGNGGIYCKECGASQNALAETDFIPQPD